ncbi:LL-diaminopimelate aminotransferase [Ensifer sp. YR511]|uniref:LL-diaminopimelate aminotransferase n=1 Tax=Ensifer sp. YR511 TaxID=1855294 RepID=UPI000889FA4B|nr:LL-diaminopimelate aminotransferase [Ensifer sp. YR511]SDN39561.1 alanine-synthesizing transaminase [Ensifer sp. YR511]
MADFHTIKRLPAYVFEPVNRLKERALANGVDIIDLGMGNPDMPTPPAIVEKLREAVMDPRSHRYSTSRGIADLRRAQAAYYARRFGVKLNPETEVAATLGSKEGFANMAQAITAPGDVVLCPNPTYPIHPFGFIMAGGVVRSISGLPDDTFFGPVERAIRHSIPKPIAIVLNYPANPTGHVASVDFYKDVIAFARKHHLIVLSDLAYAEIYFGDEPPPSVLQVNGAAEVAVEFTTMSKAFAMPGWRLGFAVGNERLLAALMRVKSYLDYGAFTPIQMAAAAALEGDGSEIAEIRSIYRRRRDVLVESFTEAGLEVPPPDAGMFAWLPIPKRFSDLGSIGFSKRLIEQANVAVAPGIGFGDQGDNHIRVALVENEQRIRQAAASIGKVLLSAGHAADFKPKPASR